MIGCFHEVHDARIAGQAVYRSADVDAVVSARLYRDGVVGGVEKLVGVDVDHFERKRIQIR